MSRPLRIQYPNAWYHVMNRGRRAEAIFESPEDYFTFVKLLKETVDLWNLRVSAYCLLSNHYHLAYSDKTVHLIRRIASTRSEDNRPRVPKVSVH